MRFSAKRFLPVRSYSSDVILRFPSLHRMPFLFANSAGFWALLGIPAVLLIHFLHRESRRLPISTLFLLASLEKESTQGRKFDRLRQSVPLWLQLLAVLILTWLLTEPRWTSRQTVQRVALVLDSSASMSAFLDPLKKALQQSIPPLTALVGTTEYSLTESHKSGRTLYRGTSFTELLQSLDTWNPAAPTHSPEPALRVGRSLAGSEGVLIYLTDHLPYQVPYGASVLSIGNPIENVGFAGLRVDTSADGETWQATLRNYSPKAQSRRWFVAIGTQRGEARKAELSATSSLVLKGKFPEGVAQLSLILDPDLFEQDDTLYLVRPSPKPLVVSRESSPDLEALIRSLSDSIENVSIVPESTAADLCFSSYNPLNPTSFPPTSIVFLHQGTLLNRFYPGLLVAANHSLVAELDWQGLIAKSGASIPVLPDENVLLWQGERALILLRETAEGRALIFNFDVANSNAARLPAFVILIHRFIETVRARKIAPESKNGEIGQRLGLPAGLFSLADEITLKSEGIEKKVPSAQAPYLRAPERAGFFQVLASDTLLLDASANFADTREADFTAASTFSDLGTLPGKIQERQTVADPYWQIWILLILFLLLASWYFLHRKKRAAPDFPEIAEAIPNGNS